MVKQSVAKPARHFVIKSGKFSVFINRIRNQFLKKMNNDNGLSLHSMAKLSGKIRY